MDKHDEYMKLIAENQKVINELIQAILKLEQKLHDHEDVVESFKADEQQ